MTRLSDQVQTITVSTKRTASPVSGQFSDPVAYLTGVKSTPIMPLDEELAERYALMEMYELKQAYIFGALDIVEGDYLVHGSVEYRISAVGEWPYRNGTWLRLILEEDKGV
jgi:hypothetical protein